MSRAASLETCVKSASKLLPVYLFSRAVKISSLTLSLPKAETGEKKLQQQAIKTIILKRVLWDINFNLSPLYLKLSK